MKKQKTTKSLKFPIYLTNGLLALAGSAYILYPGLRGYAGIQASKFAMFCILFGGYLALMLLLGVEALVTGKLRPPSLRDVWRRSSVAQKCVLGYWGVSAVSTLLSQYRTEALLGMTRNEGLLTISIYCACFLCVSSFARPRRYLVALLGTTMSVFAAICIWQLCGGNPLGLYPSGTNYFGAGVDYAGEYLGTIGNADLTAALLSMAILIFAVVLIKGKDSRRYLLLIPIALCLAALLLSGVRSGVLAVLLSALFAVPTAVAENKRVRRGLILGAAAVLLAVLLLVYNSHAASGTVYELSRILHGDWQEDFGSGRIAIWKRVLALVPRHLWLGTGPDTMRAASIVWGYREVNGVDVGVLIDVAHNEYLNILYHQGVFALLFYLAALCASLVQWIRCAGRDAAVAACGTGVLSYMIWAFFGFSMCQTAGIFWLVFALLDSALDKGEVTT